MRRFNPDCYTFITPTCAPEDDIDCDDAENDSEDEKIEITQRVDLLSQEDRRKWEAYEEVMLDHESLLDNDASLLQSKLQSCLGQFPNLKILGMRRSEDHSPWGWRRLTDMIGEDPRVLGPIPTDTPNGLSSPTKLFNNIVSVVAATGIRLQRLYTDAVEVSTEIQETSGGLRTAYVALKGHLPDKPSMSVGCRDRHSQILSRARNPSPYMTPAF